MESLPRACYPAQVLLLLSACSRAPSDAEVATATLTAAGAGEVRAYVNDGAGFAAPTALPLRALTSLDAYAEGDTVLVTGLSHAIVPTAMAERFPQLFVIGLESTDLTTWAAHAWRVDAPGSSLIDPSFVQGPEGRELWFVQVDSHGDPAQGGLPSTLVRTHWDGETFSRAETLFTGPGLVDPSPVFSGDRWEVFLTHDHHEVVRLAQGATATERVREGLTVPHARREGTRVILTAQGTQQGPATPVEMAREDGQGWSEPRALLPAGSPPCSSPSTVRRAGKTVLLCAGDRPGGERPGGR